MLFPAIRQALGVVCNKMRQFSMRNFLLFSLLLLSIGCNNSKDFTKDFEKHKFDLVIIQKLPLYDTLRQIILNNYDSFHLTNEKDYFDYIYNFDTSTQISGHSNKDVPTKIYQRTVQLFNQIGSDNIFGFTLSKDSTLEFLIRNTHLTDYYLDVRERLYWYPDSNKLIKSSFPIKDTILNDKWQYQIWYDKRAEF
jgi:hypothetical protein